jgi:ribosome maturation factor RimP
LKKFLILKDEIVRLAEQHLEGTPLYLTGVRVSADNHISLFIDGDEGVTINDCVGLSRAVESALDRERDDFSLVVSSHGATSPLTLPRQFKKHQGRELEIRTMDGAKAEGKLIYSDEKKIGIEFSVRENKPVGKGKVTVTKQQEFEYNNIKEAKIKLKY